MHTNDFVFAKGHEVAKDTIKNGIFAKLPAICLFYAWIIHRFALTNQKLSYENYEVQEADLKWVKKQLMSKQTNKESFE